MNDQYFLSEEFPVAIRSYFVSALLRAYGLVKELQKDNKWLNWPSKSTLGNDALGILRKIAAEYCIVQTIKDNNLPISYTVLPNASRNASHIELITDHCRTTINQVESKMSLPRPAVYRQLLIPSEQGRLFDDQIGFDYSEKPIYVILAHKSDGHYLQSAILGIPQFNMRRWATKPLNLLIEPRRIQPVPTEIIRKDEILITLNNFTEDVLRNGKKEENEQ